MARASDVVAGIRRDHAKLVPSVLKYLNDLVLRSEPLVVPLSVHFVKTKDERVGDMAEEVTQRMEDIREMAAILIGDPSIPEATEKELREKYPALFKQEEASPITFDDVDSVTLADEPETGGSTVIPQAVLELPLDVAPPEKGTTVVAGIATNAKHDTKPAPLPAQAAVPPKAAVTSTPTASAAPQPAPTGSPAKYA